MVVTVHLTCFCVVCIEVAITRYWLHKTQIQCRCQESYMLLVYSTYIDVAATKYWLHKTQF